MKELIHAVFFADSESMTWWTMVIRGILIYFLTMLYIKMGGKRMFSNYGAFDIVMGIMLGALLAKAIEGSAKFIPAIITTFIMVLMHRILAKISVNNHLIGKHIKGNSILLVRDGKMLKEEMKQSDISEEDLLEAMRLGSTLNDLSMAKEVYLERNGKISFVS